MVTRRKPKTTQNNDAVKSDEVKNDTNTESTEEKVNSPVTEKKQPVAKKEPEKTIIPARRVWPD